MTIPSTESELLRELRLQHVRPQDYVPYNGSTILHLVLRAWRMGRTLGRKEGQDGEHHEPMGTDGKRIRATEP
jgi:hypothetical protein